MDATTPKLDGKVRLYRDAAGKATRLLAFGELMIGGSFVIKGIRVLRRDEGEGDEAFVSFPAERGKGAAQDKWFDLAHPVTREAHRAATELLLGLYRKAREGEQAAARG